MTIDHDTPAHRFTVRTPDGTGELVYAETGDRTLDLRHTFVEPALRGTGAADALVRAALAYAHEHGYRVTVSCPYVRDWLQRHPDERDALST